MAEVKEKKICCKLICNLFGLGLGIGLIVFGALALQNNLLAGPYDLYLKMRFGLRPDSEALFDWASLFENGLIQKYYVYNITNAPEVIQYGAHPEFKKLGPYIYKVSRRREDVQINPATRDETLNYTLADYYSVQQNAYYDYDSYRYRSSSYGSGRPRGESDVIYTLNLPMLTLAAELDKINRTEHNYYWQQSVASNVHQEWTNYESDEFNKEQKPVNGSIPQYILDLFNKEHIVTKVTVDNLLWGWQSDALEYAKNAIKKRYNVLIVNDSTHGLSYQIGQKRKTKRQGYSIATGINDIDSINKIKTVGNIWADRWSSDGTLFPPHHFHDYRYFERNPKIFIPDFCSPKVAFGCRKTDKENDEYDFLYTFTNNDEMDITDVKECHDGRPIEVGLAYDNEYHYDNDADGFGPRESDIGLWLTMDKYTGKLFSYQQNIHFYGNVLHSALFPESIKLRANSRIPIAFKQESFALMENDDVYDLDNWNAMERLKSQSWEVKAVRSAAVKWIPVGSIILGSFILFLFCLVKLIKTVRFCKKNCKNIKVHCQGDYVFLSQVVENLSASSGQRTNAGNQFTANIQSKGCGQTNGSAKFTSSSDDVDILVDVSEDTPNKQEGANEGQGAPASDPMDTEKLIDI